MNKKSNFTRTVLLSALLCGIAGPSFVGCKDYDDDIDALQAQIDENKDAIAALEQQISGGAIVTKVESDGNGGVVITLSDGTKHTITKGDKGDDGVSAPTPIFQISNGILQVRYSTEEAWQDLGKVTPDAEALEFTIDEATGELMLNGESLGKVVGEAGKPLAVDFRISDTGMLEYLNQEGEWVEIGQVTGANGATPKLQFKLENGQLMYQDANAIEPEWVAVDGFNMNDILTNYMTLSVDENGMLCVGGEPTDVQVNYEIYLVEKDGAMMLHLPYKDAEQGWIYRDITLPTTDIFGKIVTSVNFVPMTPNGNDLSVYKLKVLDPTTGVVAVPADFVRATQSELRFRVNPSTAVYGKDKDFTVAESMDYFLASRAADGMFKALNPEVREDGLLYVDFAFDAEKVATDKTYTLALALNDNHNEGRTIYSNYITFSAAGSDVDDIAMCKSDLTSIDLTALKLEWKEGAVLDLSEEGLIAASEASVSGLTTYTPLSNYGFNPEITITTTETGIEKDFIKVDGLKLTLADPSFQTKDKDVEFNVDVRVDGKLIHRESMKVTIEEFKDERTFPGLIADQIVNNFIKNQVTLTEEELQLNASVWNQIETFFVGDADNTTIIWYVNGEELSAYNDASCALSFFENWGSATKNVVVKSSAEAGEYNVTMEIVNGMKVATSTFKVTVNNANLTENEEYWNSNKELTVRVNSDKELKADLTNVFERVPGAKVVFSSSSSDVIITDNVIELSATGLKKVPVGGTYSVPVSYVLRNETTGENITTLVTTNVIFHNPIKSVEFPVKNIEINDGENAPIDMTQTLINMIVTDRVSGEDKYIIRNGQVVVTPEEGEELAADEALAADYGVTTIEYTSTDTRFTDNGDGTFSWKNGSGAISGQYTFQVTVTITNKWKDVVEKELITITVNEN